MAPSTHRASRAAVEGRQLAAGPLLHPPSTRQYIVHKRRMERLGQNLDTDPVSCHLSETPDRRAKPSRNKIWQRRATSSVLQRLLRSSIRSEWMEGQFGLRLDATDAGTTNQQRARG